MKLSEKAEKELIELAGSEDFRRDMERLSMRNRTPFMKDGLPDADAFIEFVMQFNEFINHKPKPFKPMIDKDMKL